jgi:hypothetical protein
MIANLLDEFGDSFSVMYLKNIPDDYMEHKI